MAHYIEVKLRVEVDGDLEEDELEKLYDERPEVEVDGTQVALDWDTLNADEPFAWAEIMGWDIIEYDSTDNW